MSEVSAAAEDGAGLAGSVASAAVTASSVRKRNRDMKESAKMVLESIPQIPIHVTEIKRLILKDGTAAAAAGPAGDDLTVGGGAASASSLAAAGALDESQLLSVLTQGATGRNPTFFKAFGHEDVFGLKADIPAGGTTVDVVESVPDGSKETVLYVQLPEGHPVIVKNQDDEELAEEESAATADAVEQERPSSPVAAELSLEEAIEQAEVVFDDGFGNADAEGDVVSSGLDGDGVGDALAVASIAVQGGDSVDGEEKIEPRGNSDLNTAICQPINIDVSGSGANKPGRTLKSPNVSQVSPSTSAALGAAAKRHSPRISSRQKQQQQLNTAEPAVDDVNCDSANQTKSGSTPASESLVVAAESKASQESLSTGAAGAPSEAAPAAGPSSSSAFSSGGHNLRPKRTLRHVNALKQQAKRRKKNTTVAAGGSPTVQRTLSAKRSSLNSNGGTCVKRI